MRDHPYNPVMAKLPHGLQVRIYPHDVIGRDIYVNGVFERAEARFVMGYLSPGMIFFDVGANLGQYTLLAARAVTMSGQVHSFEPSDRMFAELSFNVELNQLANTCRLNHVAVSDRTGMARLSQYQAGAEVFGSLGNHRRDEASITGYVNVRTITLDSYVEEAGIAHIDLVKMDIEGAELLALRGASRSLSKGIIRAIVLEMSDINTRGFGYTPLDIWEYIESFGYRLHNFDTYGRISRMLEDPPDFSRDQNLVAMRR
jgi:FkbM family methyltransferase